nr:hypothetical protein [Tanacetum cinerariifolium]
MDQRMNESVEVAIQIQSNRLHNKGQAENDEFLKTINENMQKIIKEQVKEQVKTSYVIAVDLSKMELKKILIEKIEGNKSIHRSNEQRNLYKALIQAYKSDKIILDTYRDTVTLKRRRDDDADKDEEPSAGLDRGSKRRREGKEPESASAPKEKATRSAGKSTQGCKYRQTSASESAIAEEPMQTTHEMEEPSHPEFETGADDQPIVESSQHPEWFSQQKKPPTLDRDWNKTFLVTDISIQPWISDLAKQTDSHSSFNELMDTLVDFSTFMMNRLKVDTLTPELLAGPTYELMKGLCKSLVELKFFLEEVYKETIDQLNWVNPKGQQYPHNLLKPLPLIPNSRGRRVIPFDHFINNDLEYLCGGALIRKYTTFVTKTKAADYGHIKWIEDVVPRTIIIAVTELKIIEWHNYKHLDWITVRKDDDKLYKFKEGNFKRLHIQDIEDIIVIQRHVEDLQLSVKSYQKKLNLTRPDTYRSDLKCKEAYIAYSNPRGFVYQNKDKKNMLMLNDELYKFSDGMLTDVRTALDDRLKGIRMKKLKDGGEGAELEPLEPGFEFDDQEWIKMGLFLFVRLEMRIPTRQETEVPQTSSPTHTHVADEATSTSLDVRHGGAATTGDFKRMGEGSIVPVESYLTPSDGAASTGVDVRHGGAVTTVSSLDARHGSDRVLAFETDLQQTKKVYRVAFTKLIMKLWDLVKERFSITEPTDDKQKELWVELKRLFELRINILPVRIKAPSELPKEHIKSMRENDKEEKFKQDMAEIETISIELEHSVAKLLSKNELLHKEIKHLKKIYKDQFDSIKKTRVYIKEHSDSLIAQLNSKSMENADLKGQTQEKVFVTTSLQNELRRLKGKNVLNNATTITNATTVALGMFKLDIKPVSHRLKNNRDAHEEYLKKTIENTDTIHELVEHTRKHNPSKPLLDSACIFTKHVQELPLRIFLEKRIAAIKGYRGGSGG